VHPWGASQLVVLDPGSFSPNFADMGYDAAVQVGVRFGLMGGECLNRSFLFPVIAMIDGHMVDVA
jgi:hypothetical protein